MTQAANAAETESTYDDLMHFRLVRQYWKLAEHFDQYVHIITALGLAIILLFFNLDTNANAIALEERHADSGAVSGLACLAWIIYVFWRDRIAAKWKPALLPVPFITLVFLLILQTLIPLILLWIVLGGISGILLGLDDYAASRHALIPAGILLLQIFLQYKQPISAIRRQLSILLLIYCSAVFLGVTGVFTHKGAVVDTKTYNNHEYVLYVGLESDSHHHFSLYECDHNGYWCQVISQLQQTSRTWYAEIMVDEQTQQVRIESRKDPPN